MNLQKVFLVVLIVVGTITSSFSQTFPFFLVGTWKMEDKQIYEQWERMDDSSLKGSSYKVKDGEKIVTEYLKIERIGENIVYTATVVNQNEGQGIDFKLNHGEKNIFSFENPAHDFPKKIIYQNINPKEINVQVIGENGKGYSFKMFKV